VSTDIIEASWRALLDSVVVGLLRHEVQPVQSGNVPVAGAF
jgi:hypothetical protein